MQPVTVIKHHNVFQNILLRLSTGLVMKLKASPQFTV
tara:strand:+ start:2846 stop:2956 length:111 start_codon:yes stop_codon:yes gene_type:complete